MIAHWCNGTFGIHLRRVHTIYSIHISHSHRPVRCESLNSLLWREKKKVFRMHIPIQRYTEYIQQQQPCASHSQCDVQKMQRNVRKGTRGARHSIADIPHSFQLCVFRGCLYSVSLFAIFFFSLIAEKYYLLDFRLTLSFSLFFSFSHFSLYLHIAIPFIGLFAQNSQ